MTDKTAMPDTTSTARRKRRRSDPTHLILLAGNAALSVWCLWLTVALYADTPPVFVKLSVRELIDDYVRSEAFGGGEPASIEAHTRSYTEDIGRVVSALSRKQGVVVFVSEAVLSDTVTDVTPDVKRILDEWQAEKEKEAAE